MTIRILNDDPRCLSPQDCQIQRKGRHCCHKCRGIARVAAMEAKAQVVRTKSNWCPDGFRELYMALTVKVGTKEARRITQQEIDRAKRRQEAQVLHDNGAWSV